MLIPLAELVKLLAASVGETAARHALLQARDSLGLRGEQFSRDLALAMLESIAKQPGILGISARFAKSRVHLM